MGGLSEEEFLAALDNYLSYNDHLTTTETTMANVQITSTGPAASDPTLETNPPPDARLLRQESLKLELPKAVAVVGCGGVGSWIALFLALAGVKTLWLFDGDTVSDHNLNRLPLPSTSVGRAKSNALAEVIKAMRPDCEVVPMPNFSPQTVDLIKLHEEVQWIAVSTDTWASRRMAYEWARDQGVSFIEAAAEGEIGSIDAAPGEWATPEEDHPGYASVPVWVGPCVAAATMAVAHIIHAHGPQLDEVNRFGFVPNVGMEFYHNRPDPNELEIPDEVA